MFKVNADGTRQVISYTEQGVTRTIEVASSSNSIATTGEGTPVYTSLAEVKNTFNTVPSTPNHTPVLSENTLKNRFSSLDKPKTEPDKTEKYLRAETSEATKNENYLDQMPLAGESKLPEGTNNSKNYLDQMSFSGESKLPEYTNS
jgi:hypothetical protein